MSHSCLDGHCLKLGVDDPGLGSVISSQAKGGTEPIKLGFSWSTSKSYKGKMVVLADVFLV